MPLTITRDGKEMTLQVKIAKLEFPDATSLWSEQTSQRRWGMELEDLTPDLARQLGAKSETGVVVAGVEPGSPADNASVQRGDIILEVNRQPVKSVDDVREKIEKARGKDSLLLLAQREGKSFYVVLKG